MYKIILLVLSVCTDTSSGCDGYQLITNRVANCNPNSIIKLDRFSVTLDANCSIIPTGCIITTKGYTTAQASIAASPTCPRCKKTFSRNDNVLRHLRSSCHAEVQPLKIQINEDQQTQLDSSRKRKRDSLVRRCQECREDVPKAHYRGHLRSNRHKANACRFLEDANVEIIQSAFEDRVMSYKLTPENDNHVKVVDLMIELQSKLCNLIKKQVEKHKNVKVNCELFGLYTLKQQEKVEVKSFQTKYEIASEGMNCAEFYNRFVEVLDRKESEFQEKDSGWVLIKLLHLEINCVKFNPMRASSYVKLPPGIAKKQAVINVCNSDEFCFGWSVASALVIPSGLPQRVQSYPDFRTLCNWDGITFPMKIKDINKFEDNNPNISINVYGLEEIKYNVEVVGPLYYTKKRKNVHINLLLVENNTGLQHYCWIKNFSRLMSAQLSNRHGAIHFCDSCLHYFRTEQALHQHIKNDCNYVYTKLPTWDAVIDKTGEIGYNNVLKFANFEKRMPVPFVVYADFESLLIPIDTPVPDPAKPFMMKTCKHEPYSFAYYIKCIENDEWSRLKVYRGTEAGATFIKWLEADVHEIYHKYLKTVKPMSTLTTQEQLDYEAAKQCFICAKEFVTAGNPKVRDHSHLTGKYRGPAHSICNLNYKMPTFVPVFFHNLSGYDAHLFIKQLATEQEEIDVIPQSKEKYVAFSKKLLMDRIVKEDGTFENIFLRIRFLDSFRFMASSLDTLSKTLTDAQCTNLRNCFSNDVKFNLIRYKGVFPYSYVDNFSKLDDDKLPRKENFYDNLREQHISEEEYQRAKKIWTTFECKSLGEYSDIYLCSDVLLLTDVFENFRAICLKVYELDPTQYMTAPGLTWDAMLKYTRVELELLTDMDMYHFFKKGIRGGVSTCIKRKSIANNLFLPKFDSQNPTSYIMFLDATNLYGHSMRDYLPQTGFSWLSSEAVSSFNVLDISDDANVGYVLEVDLHYPPNLHDHHNDLPFCPENIQPPHTKSSQKKLIPNLYDKTAYVTHYRNLKQCLQHGLILTRIHRILQFQQSPWLRKYIDLNTNLRNQSGNKFEKDFYKLMNNAVFGKTMENVDKRRKIRLLTHWQNIGRRLGLEAYVARPTFKQLTRFTEKLYAIEMTKTSVVYNKPVYVGFTILDISKTVMYRFFYDVLKSRYRQNVSLLYTDTDSLIIEVQTPNVYEDIKIQLDEYDTSNYHINNLHNIPITTSVVGKMKDEYAGKPIQSFYGAGAKCYCVNDGGQVVKKAKGVRKYVIQRDLTEMDFKRAAEGQGEVTYCKMFIFRSTLHDVYTELVNKIALCTRDDKRFVIPGTCNTLAWGHRNIKNYALTRSSAADNSEERLDVLLRVAAELQEDETVEEPPSIINPEYVDEMFDVTDVLELSWDCDLLPSTERTDIDELINEHANRLL